MLGTHLVTTDALFMACQSFFQLLFRFQCVTPDDTRKLLQNVLPSGG